MTQEPKTRTTAGHKPFLLAALGMIVLAVVLIAIKFWPEAAKPPESTPIAAPAALPPLPEAPPPPPPELPEDEPARAPEQPQAPKARRSSPLGCDDPCNGEVTGALRSALSGRAQQARGCYERALRQNQGLGGRMRLLVRVGGGGQVCSATLALDELGETAVSSCVLQRFQALAFPAPVGGCVDVEVPMNFTPQQ